MKRLLLSGYYGYGNAGDEAVLAGLVAGFRASASANALDITALSGNWGQGGFLRSRAPALARAGHACRRHC